MEEKCRPLFCVYCGLTLPQRIVMVVFCITSIFICCGQREILSLSRGLLREQYGLNTTNANATGNAGEFVWSKIDYSFVIITFPLAHFVAQVPAGFLIDRFGAKWFYIGGVCLSSIMTIVTPVAIATSTAVVFVVRAFLGIAQSVLFPAVAVIIARWIPYTERGLWGSLTFASYPAAIVLCKTNAAIYGQKWSATLYIWGGAGFVWCGVIYLFLYNSPKLHPLITEQELAYLEEKITPKTLKAISIKTKAKKDLAVWALLIGQHGHNYTTIIMQFNMWIYMRKMFVITMADIAVVQVGSFIGFWVAAVFSGKIVDHLIVDKGRSARWTRRITTFISFAISNLFLAIISLVSQHVIAFHICYGIAVASKGVHYAGFGINHMDLSVNFIGTLMASINFVGDMVGGTLVFCVSNFAPSDASLAFMIEAWIAFGLSLITATFYLLLAKAERAEWDQTEEAG